MSGSFAAQAGGGNSPQLGIKKRDQAVPRVGIRPIAQKFGYLVVVRVTCRRHLEAY